MASAFFYGTLMHPKILKRVIKHDGSYLQIRPAVLLDYTRHKINGEDYPGIVPYSQSRAMFDRELELEERCVRGTLVAGLSDRDIRLLDVFEGDEYVRELAEVHPLGPPVALDETDMAEVARPMPPVDELGTPTEVNTYVWCRPLTEMQPKLWRFDEFVKENAWKWIGPGSRDRADYTEVDRRHAMEGAIAGRAHV